jgi:hypothetical protein
MRVLTNLKDTVATDALIGRIPIGALDTPPNRAKYRRACAERYALVASNHLEHCMPDRGRKFQGYKHRYGAASFRATSTVRLMSPNYTYTYTKLIWPPSAHIP